MEYNSLADLKNIKKEHVMGVYQATVNNDIMRFKRPHAWLTLKAAWEKYSIGLTWMRLAAEDGVRIAFKELSGN
jgi:hypothetical protein